jgi:hypothetical protein
MPVFRHHVRIFAASMARDRKILSNETPHYLTGLHVSALVSNGPWPGGVEKKGRLVAAVPVFLFLKREVATSILLPALFVRLGAEGLFLAVADGFYSIRRHACLDQCIPNRISAIIA